MTPDLHREFRLLSERAKLQLRDVPESSSYRHVLSLWRMPSFAPSSRCTVYSPFPHAKGNQPFAEFTIWRSDLDLEKLISPVERLKYPRHLAPTLQTEVLWLTDGEVEAMEQRICGISIPLNCGGSSVGGCDGTSFEFRFDELFFGAAIHWWEDQPSEWRPLTKELMRMTSELEERLQMNQRNAAPNGGPTTPLNNPGITETTPSA